MGNEISPKRAVYIEYSLPPKFSSLSTNSSDIPPPIINIAFVHRELTAMAQMIKIACNAVDPGSIPGLGKFPAREWLSTPVFLPGELHGQRSLVGPVHGVSKSKT